MLDKIIPYGRQDISDEDIASVVRVLRSDFLTQGPAVESFEASFSEYIGCSHSVAVSNGTAGLHIAYLAAGVGPGDAVIVPAITFAATANAAVYCGGTPVFCDVDPETACISIDSLKQAIILAKSNGLKIKVITPVHYAGRPCDMASIYEVSKNENAVVIEDACHAIGAEWRYNSNEEWLKIGKLPHTSMTVFSFHPVKHITTGEGGMITTNSLELALRLRKLRSHGIEKNPTFFQNKENAFDRSTATPNPWYYEMQEMGFNYRMCDIQAALGESQIKRLDKFIEERRFVAQFYYKNLVGTADLLLPPEDTASARNSLHLFPIRSDKICSGRAKLMNQLRELGIGTQVHYLPVPEHPFYQNKNYPMTTIPLSHKYYASSLSIPMHTSLSQSQLSNIVAAVKFSLT